MKGAMGTLANQAKTGKVHTAKTMTTLAAKSQAMAPKPPKTKGKKK